MWILRRIPYNSFYPRSHLNWKSTNVWNSWEDSNKMCVEQRALAVHTVRFFSSFSRLITTFFVCLSPCFSMDNFKKCLKHSGKSLFNPHPFIFFSSSFNNRRESRNTTTSKVYRQRGGIKNRLSLSSFKLFQVGGEKQVFPPLSFFWNSNVIQHPPRFGKISFLSR